MKKMISLLLALTMLCSMLPMSALAAYDTSKPYCQRDDHAKNDGMDHNRPQSCWTKGHFNCDGLDHSAAPCGVWHHFNCDGREHPAASCGIAGHYACKGDHGQAVCGIEGHYACENGHTARVNEYCNAEPKHTLCQKNEEHTCESCGETYACKDSKKHIPCQMCGLPVCDLSLGEHYAPCGYREHRICYYTLQGKVWRASEHPDCHLCGKGKCSGSHGLGVCVDYCTQCNKPLTNGEWTHRAECGKHFTCISKGLDHSWCDKCNMLKCASAHKATHNKK